jgi:hypothetical protein
MKVQFYSGPDRIPFQLNERGMVEDISAIPFHGIISSGLVNKIASKKEIGQLWHQYASILFAENGHLVDPNFEILKAEVDAAKVLSFGQSAIAAMKYIEQHLADRIFSERFAIDVWNIKEGHTSSVWKVSVEESATIETFVLNVARDAEASEELKETSEKLMTIGRMFPDIAMAKVLHMISLKDDFLPFPVIVTRNEWVDNSFEVHSRRNKNTGEDELLLIERFLTDSNDPTFITSILGRRCTVFETTKINEDLNYFLTNAASCLNEKPSLNINDGDVVWDGEKAIVVAIS